MHEMNATTPNGHHLQIRWSDANKPGAVNVIGVAEGCDWPYETEVPMGEVLLHFTMFLDRLDEVVKSHQRPILPGTKQTLRYDGHMVASTLVTSVRRISNGFIVTIDHPIRSLRMSGESESNQIFMPHDYQWVEDYPNLDIARSMWSAALTTA